MDCDITAIILQIQAKSNWEMGDVCCVRQFHLNYSPSKMDEWRKLTTVRTSEGLWRKLEDGSVAFDDWVFNPPEGNQAVVDDDGNPMWWCIDGDVNGDHKVYTLTY